MKAGELTVEQIEKRHPPEHLAALGNKDMEEMRWLLAECKRLGAMFGRFIPLADELDNTAPSRDLYVSGRIDERHCIAKRIREILEGES